MSDFVSFPLFGFTLVRKLSVYFYQLRILEMFEDEIHKLKRK